MRWREEAGSHDHDHDSPGHTPQPACFEPDEDLCVIRRGYKTRTGLASTRCRKRKRTGMSRSRSRSRTSMRSTSMSRSSAPVDVSGGRARRPRHHPRPRRVVGAGGAREEPARGAAERRAMHGRRQRRAAMQYIREPCKRGATRNARVASSRDPSKVGKCAPKSENQQRVH